MRYVLAPVMLFQTRCGCILAASRVISLCLIRPLHVPRDVPHRFALGCVRCGNEVVILLMSPSCSERTISLAGSEVPLGLCDKPADPWESWLYHGGRNGAGQNPAVHHAHVDAPPAKSRLQARNWESHGGVSLQPGAKLVQRSGEMAGGEDPAAGHWWRLQRRDWP